MPGVKLEEISSEILPIAVSSNLYASGGASWIPLSADSAGRLYTVLSNQTAMLSSNEYGYNTTLSAWAPLSLDPDTGTLVSIDQTHHEVHKGNMYTTDWYADGLTNTSSANLVFEVGAKEAHLIYEVQAEMEIHFTINGGITYGASGTSLAKLNKDRNSTNTSTAFLHYTPTTPSLSAATLLRTRHFGSGSTPAGMGTGDRGLYEFILKANTKYLFQVINQSGGSGWYAFYLNWYEIVP
jgi:hypothetical protein